MAEIVSYLADSKSFTKRILKSASYLVLGSVAASAGGFIFKYIMVHIWSTSDFGIFTLILTIVGILGFLNEFSLNCTTTVFLSKNIDSTSRWRLLLEIFSVFLLLTAVVVIITTAALFVNIRTAVFEVLGKYYYFIMSIVILTAFTNICYGILRGYKKMNYEAAVNVFKTLVLLGMSVGTVYLFARRSIDDMLSVMVLVHLLVVGAILLLFARKRKISDAGIAGTMLGVMREAIRPAQLKPVIVYSFFISTLSLFNILLVSVDRMLIPHFFSTAMLGLYGGAALVASIPRLATGSFANAAMPWISEASHDRPALKRKYLHLFLFFIPCALIGYALCAVFARHLMMLFLKPEFYASLRVLQLLFLGAFFSDIYLINSTFVAAAGTAGDLGRLVLLLTASLVANVVLNLLLIPALGLYGAALAYAAAFLLAGFGSSYQVFGGK